MTVIVECSNCQTRFQLDDSRVPLAGVRVRCSRCKEAFFLEHPDASDDDAVHDVAARAVETERVSVEHSEDLAPTDEIAESTEASSTESEEEEDWEFNEELPDDPDEVLEVDAGPLDEDSDSLDEDVDLDLDDDDMRVPGLGIDETSSDGQSLAEDLGESSEAGSGLDLADLALDSSEDVDFDAGDDASDFGEAADFSALVDEDDEEEVLGAGPSEPIAPSPPTAQPGPTAAAREDVGEPEDWDFFSDESLEAPGSMEPLDGETGLAVETVEADPPVRSGPQQGPELAAASNDGRSSRGVAAIVGLIGWSITLCLFGLGIARGVLHIGAPSSTPPTVVKLGALQAEEIRASWVETLRPSPLYSVRGRLVNVDSQPRMAGPGMQVALLSSDGTRLQAPAAMAGVPLRAALLRELPSETIAEFADDSAAELASTRLEPGETVEFEAFFDRVPDEASSFMVEMTEAPPVAPAVEPAWDTLDAEDLGPTDGQRQPTAESTTRSASPTTPSFASAPPGTPAPSLP